MCRFHYVIPLLAVSLFSQQQSYQSDTLVVRSILDTNHLTSVPVRAVVDSAGGRVVSLKLDNLGIWRLPEAVCSLSALTSLSIREGLLNDRLPQCVGMLSQLKAVDLMNSWVEVIPESFWDLTGIQYLNLRGSCWVCNDTAQCVPTALGKLVNLRFLCLRSNGIQCLPMEILSLDRLDTLDIGGNMLCSRPMSTAIVQWLNAHDPDWRQGNGCTPVIRSLARRHVLKPISSTSPVALHDLQGKLVGVMPLAQVNQRLWCISGGTYLLVLPGEHGAAKIVPCDD